MLETLDYTIRIGSTPTFLYFDIDDSLLSISGFDISARTVRLAEVAESVSIWEKTSAV